MTMLVAFAPSLAQTKYEVETRIKRNEVPAAAIQWFTDAYGSVSRVRWYMETSERGTSFEAKLNWNGMRNSVEFDSIGQVEDIEITIPIGKMDDTERKLVDSVLNERFDQYRLLKVQRQWTGDTEALKQMILGKEANGLTERLEIEAYCKIDMKDGYRELLLTMDGSVVNDRPMDMNTTDHLNY